MAMTGAMLARRYVDTSRVVPRHPDHPRALAGHGDGDFLIVLAIIVSSGAGYVAAVLRIYTTMCSLGLGLQLL
ncbi:hypothetical protein CC85DRAFT_284595 [Cutaneotrichosporon oleaginosum]|uniref:Uncharacterized protein n=1 Tax=Cutaneotrichosporon oleaginosum TaxID=879819 RepID=A0A0J0XQW0_9TREE|nr:uncharacterized protein CC85DRAFT_284595 [Cutaneotrichosporon oleaginosum]KLT43455.1 hypothetical protein CC85DRAFT_284595 [Cutaneotrichosporon oleaginosum]TXT05332.1 hypothetical protein COLE_06652 [Cutaneotrichosporon oleaginosum]